ncbi:hypothetical protein QAD02_018212 [Eretmocerus hayati]|uniref:Uncharacterized protein n=1 Tax=Eretmocerus hayati TaxID=131215 RepID=A0ACC2PFS1_9HYME|nr:hypothetical protein QAD02_018212 [Eretmocerus hayati]
MQKKFNNVTISLESVKQTSIPSNKSKRKQLLANRSFSDNTIINKVSKKRNVDVIELSDDDDQSNTEINDIRNESIHGSNSNFIYHINPDGSIRVDEEKSHSSCMQPTMIMGQQRVESGKPQSIMTQDDQQEMDGSCSKEFSQDEPLLTFVLHDSKLRLVDMNDLVEENGVCKIKKKPLSKKQLIHPNALINQEFQLKNSNTIQLDRPMCSNEIVPSDETNHVAHKPLEQITDTHNMNFHAVGHEMFREFPSFDPKTIKTKQKPINLRQPTHPNGPVQENLQLHWTNSIQFASPIVFNGNVTPDSLLEDFEASMLSEEFGVCQEQRNDETLVQAEHESLANQERVKSKSKVTSRKLTSILSLKKEVAELRRNIVTMKANQRREVKEEVHRVLQDILSPEIVQNLVDLKNKSKHSMLDLTPATSQDDL